ncbi:PREDICTED: zinc finger C2HC domain-containing protein 1C [Nanorana parkeri]|uniref:zinc finger C2HC domain-containing protein 1C n=1 Tax=Nanorana parkeri TaxID=125878 RepID=UPI00085431DA|nr:PREDICTED: zinc finger C2HC domain-containing protein 1C [Nanorana parkeri]
MARLTLAPSAYPEGLPDPRLPALQAPKIPSRLEILRNDFQERSLRAKEEKILNLLTQQQERISHRVAAPSLYTQHKPYVGPWAPEEKAWASNWTVTKRTAGIDRAHPLKPVYHHKATTRITDNHHPPSANTTRYKSSPPIQEQPRSKSGPARTDSWHHLETKGSSLEAEIRRKEALLREKLRKTEEELRRIQREKAETQDRRGTEMQNTRRGRVATTQNRAIKTFHEPIYTEEDGGDRAHPREDRFHSGEDRFHPGGDRAHPREDRAHPREDRAHPREDRFHSGEDRFHSGEDRFHPGGDRAHPREDRFHPGGDRFHPTEDRFHPGGDRAHPREDRFHPGGDRSHPEVNRLYQDMEAKIQIKEPPSDRKSKHLRQAGNVTPSPTKGPSHIRVAPDDRYTHRSSMAGPIQEDNGEDLVPCQLCGRSFMVHRLEKHTQVCQKMMNSKRKVFDSSKARAKGTDLEQFLHTKGKLKDPPPQVKRSSWRQKHESFMRTIRQARLVQDVVSRGGKASDVPPPPPEENPDYITCPHCNRRFAPPATERHIPKCETIKCKPRPPPARRR